MNIIQGLNADESALIEEKTHIVDKNMEALRLGIEEAQVRIFFALKKYMIIFLLVS